MAASRWLSGRFRVEWPNSLGVEKVELKLQEGEVHITVALPKKELWVCPECLERAPGQTERPFRSKVSRDSGHGEHGFREC